MVRLQNGHSIMQDPKKLPTSMKEGAPNRNKAYTGYPDPAAFDSSMQDSYVFIAVRIKEVLLRQELARRDVK